MKIKTINGNDVSRLIRYFCEKIYVMSVAKCLSSRASVKIIRSMLCMSILILIFYPLISNSKYINEKLFRPPDYLRFTSAGNVIPAIASIVACITGNLLVLFVIFLSLLILNKNLLCGFLGCTQHPFNSTAYTKEAMFFAVPYTIFTHVLMLYLIIYFLNKFFKMMRNK